MSRYGRSEFVRILGERQQETAWFAMAYDAVGRANSPYPKGRADMTSNSIAKVLNRDTNPDFRTFPKGEWGISHHIRRHIALINES